MIFDLLPFKAMKMFPNLQDGVKLNIQPLRWSSFAGSCPSLAMHIDQSKVMKPCSFVVNLLNPPPPFPLRLMHRYCCSGMMWLAWRLPRMHWKKPSSYLSSTLNSLLVCCLHWIFFYMRAYGHPCLPHHPSSLKLSWWDPEGRILPSAKSTLHTYLKKLLPGDKLGRGNMSLLTKSGERYVVFLSHQMYLFVETKIPGI